MSSRGGSRLQTEPIAFDVAVEAGAIAVADLTGNGWRDLSVIDLRLKGAIVHERDELGRFRSVQKTSYPKAIDSTAVGELAQRS